jgi:tellurite resistance protein TerC
VMVYVDLTVTDRRSGKVSIKSSLLWSGIWIGAALSFNLLILFFLENGRQKAIEFLAGYLVEKSLSVDNLFAFLMIFNVMGVKDEHQPHVLKWGIISAIAIRVVMILCGITLINLFHPIIYFFGVLLLYGAYKMAFGEDAPIDLKNNSIVKVISKFFNIDTDYKGKRFFVKNKGKILLTPLFLTLILIEVADVIFNVDSIPAVIAITTDPFIVITSNIFAILGLRALYFALAGMVDLFGYLKYGVSVILTYIGVKMLITDYYEIPTSISLIVIIFFLSFSIFLSLMKKPKVS